MERSVWIAVSMFLSHLIAGRPKMFAPLLCSKQGPAVCVNSDGPEEPSANEGLECAAASFLRSFLSNSCVWHRGPGSSSRQEQTRCLAPGMCKPSRLWRTAPRPCLVFHGSSWSRKFPADRTSRSSATAQTPPSLAKPGLALLIAR